MASAPKKDIVSRVKGAIPLGETKSLPELARSLKVPMQTIADEVSGSYEGVDLLVGFRTGNGYAELPMREWSVEHYQA